MGAIEKPDDPALERRSLRLSLSSNLLIGVAGVAAALTSNSQALLVDGLFSLVGCFAALVGLKVSEQVQKGPDRYRPLGYGMDEALFTTFRSFFLLGLVAFAAINALISIYDYVSEGAAKSLNYAPIGTYMVFVLLVSASMWFSHRNAWRKTGRHSEVLRVEADAVAFDGIMTLAAGLGFLAIYLLQDSALAVIAPIGDSLIVLVLCIFASYSFFHTFRRSLGELAGVVADPKTTRIAIQTVRATLRNWEGRIVDIATLRAGRTISVLAYLDPKSRVDAADVDALTRKIAAPLNDRMGQTDVLVIITREGRSILRARRTNNSP